MYNDHMKGMSYLAVMGALCFMLSPVQAEPATSLADGVALFDTAFAEWSCEGFVAAGRVFAAGARREPRSFQAYYWQGVAAFHAALCSREAGSDEFGGRAAGYLQEAGAAFESALKISPEDAECHALLGTLAGIQITRHPLTAVWRGPLVRRHQRLALKYGPDNPRVHYLIGSSYYHAPAILGDRRQALTYFLKAEVLFEHEASLPADPLRPRWGHSSCLTFIGKLYDASGESRKADQYYRKALKVNPRDRLAQQALGTK